MEWPDRVYALERVLRGLPRGDDEGARAALITLWQTLNDAPMGILQLYINLSEESIMQAADAVADLHGEDFGFRPAPGLNAKELVRLLAISIRALEGLIIEQSSEARPAEPEKEWRVAVGETSFYLIPYPRLKTAPLPKDDFRPFTRRGVKRFRILPCKIGDYDVKLACLDVTDDRAELRFGAALFQSIDFGIAADAKSFLVTSLSGDKLPEQIDEHVTQANVAGCAGAVFPELTIDPGGRKHIQDLLCNKPWIETDPQRQWQSLDFVVAGSWHEMEPGMSDTYANVATVFDGDGTELLRHKKLIAFQGADRLMERIEPGKLITILVARRVLYAFGICLDFAQKGFDGPYRLLDVDFVMIASCGNDTTMGSHIDNAKTADVRFSTRPFVVQQAYPKLPYSTLNKEGFGFVLHPQMKLDGLTPSACVTSEGWGTFMVPILL